MTHTRWTAYLAKIEADSVDPKVIRSLVERAQAIAANAGTLRATLPFADRAPTGDLRVIGEKAVECVLSAMREARAAETELTDTSTPRAFVAARGRLTDAHAHLIRAHSLHLQYADASRRHYVEREERAEAAYLAVVAGTF